jgi:hypothetical protein
MRKTVFLTALIFLFSGALRTLHAQPSIPVDLLTGRAQVSVPFWQLNYGSLSVPVGISYHSGGVKASDTEGLAGMSWNLVAGGSVSREMRGVPDDYFGSTDATDLRKGWLHNIVAQNTSGYTPTANDDLSICSDENADWTFLNNLAFRNDTEPDVFTFNAPGLSGQFVFGTDKLPKLVPYQDVKIIITPTTITLPIIAITIIKNDGTKYYFTLSEKTTKQAIPYTFKTITQFVRDRELYRKPIEYTSAWLLTKIEGPTGEVIDFVYTASQVSGAKKEVEIIRSNGAVDKHYKITEYITNYKLSYIQSPANKVSFEYINGNTLLSRVTILDRVLNSNKEFFLQYKSVKHQNDPSSDTRAFLSEIKEQSNGCNSFPSYTFEYYGLSSANNLTSIPFYDSIKQDLWGYYNNWAVNRKPTIYFYGSRTNAERYRFYPLAGVTAQNTINGGSNRAVNPDSVKSGSLKKITYPTGGSALISYEPNDYHDVEANLTNYGPGIRVKRITLQDGVANAPNTVIDYEYKMVDNKSSGKWVSRSVFGYHDVSNFYALRTDLSPDPTLLYERATMKQTGKGKTVYEYILPGMYPLTTQAGYADWSSPKVKIARSTTSNCLAVGSLQIGYYLQPFAPNTNYDFERGLINKISDYSETGQLLHEKVFTYQRLGSPAVVVNGIRYERLRNVDLSPNGSTGYTNPSDNLYVYAKYSILANVGKVVLTETERTADMNDVTKFWSTTNTYTFSGTHYMLQHLTQAGSDGITYKKRFKYAKDFAGITTPSSTDTVAQALKKLNDDNRHGVIIETINLSISGTETLAGATLSVYNYFGSSVFPKEMRVFKLDTIFTETTYSPLVGANQTFKARGYLANTVIENYDSIGNPLTIRDQSKSKKAFHIGYGKTLPVVSISNASADQVVYAGFESYTGGEFNIVPTGLTYPAGWTGKKAILMNTSTTLERTSVRKGLGNSYRFSAMILSATAAQLTFKIWNGATLLYAGVLSYTASDVNQWKYLEGRIPISTPALPATYKLTVQSNATATVDDICFYPESASINTFTYEPLVGKTSETDTRGVSTFYDYDDIGRLKYLKDQDKTLRQTNDYYYKVQPKPAINSTFTADKAPYQVVTGVTVNYFAPINCAAPVIYNWYINDVFQSSGSSFSYTFLLKQKYTVKMVTTHPTYGVSSTSVDYDVKILSSAPVSLTVLDQDGTNTYSYCNGPYSKVFSTALGGCYILEDVNFEWYYSLGAGWIAADGNCTIVNTATGQNMTFNALTAFNGINSLAAYQIKCVITAICPTGPNGAVTSTIESTRSITYNGSKICL